MPAYQRGKTWYASYQINGVKYRKATEATSKREAERIAEELRHAEIEGQKRRASDVSFSEAMLTFLSDYCGVTFINNEIDFRERRVRWGTADRYITSSRMLTPFFGEMYLSDVQTTDIKAYAMARRETGVTDATILRDIRLLSKMYNYWVSERPDRVKYNPVASFDSKQLKDSETRIRYLTHNEVDHLLNVAKQSSNKDLYHQITFALATGLRWNEQFSLKWDMVRDTAKGKELFLPSELNKIKKYRKVPLTSEAVEVLEYLHSQPLCMRGFVFYNSDTSDRVCSNRSAWETCLDNSKITDFVWHDLRHTFATHALAKGLRIEYVSEILGHSDISITQKYAHILPSELHDAVRGLTQGLTHTPVFAS